MTDWSLIVEQFGPIVWKTAYRLLSNESDAADCFQETFISAFKFSKNNSVNHWPALLRRLATARAIDRLRQRRIEKNHITKQVDYREVPDSSNDPRQSAETAELSERLRELLCDLPPREASVFCLRSIEGLSYEEIASELDLSTNSVGVLLHKARKRLRNRLERSETNRDEMKGGRS